MLTDPMEGGPHSPWENVLGDWVQAEPRVITVTLSEEQAAMITFALLEQAKQMATPDQIEWSRLAIALNDLILEVPDGTAEPT